MLSNNDNHVALPLAYSFFMAILVFHHDLYQTSWNTTKSTFRCQWAMHSLFKGKSFYRKIAMLFIGGIGEWTKLR